MARQQQSGFTLIEAAVAIAVVAILSGIVVPLVVKNIQDSQVARAKNDVQVISGAIGSQYKDTGSRPTGTGAQGQTAATSQFWYSGPTRAATFLGIAAAFDADNTFTNLFTMAPTAAGATNPNTLFGLAATTPTTAEIAYKGPYMSQADAAKVDPWGNPYLILGYNLAQQTANGPIYVISVGPDRQVLAANVAAVPPATYTTTTTSADDIVMRVN